MFSSIFAVGLTRERENNLFETALMAHRIFSLFTSSGRYMRKFDVAKFDARKSDLENHYMLSFIVEYFLLL